MNKTKTTICILLPLFSIAALAAPSIGVATGTGKFTLNGASHRNNATIFEGNVFDSGTSDLEFRLENGATMHLGSAARGEIYGSRILLKSGGGDIRTGSTYAVDALDMHITSTDPGAVARVVVEGGQVRVGALRGELQVVNAQGVMLATITQGDAKSLTPQSGANAASGAAVGGAAAGTAAAGAAAGASAGAAAAATGAVAAGTAAAAGISTAVIVAGVAVAGAGAAAGIAVATSSGSTTPTLSPSAR